MLVQGSLHVELNMMICLCVCVSNAGSKQPVCGTQYSDLSVCQCLSVCLSVSVSNAGSRQPVCGTQYNDLSIYLSV